MTSDERQPYLRKGSETRRRVEVVIWNRIRGFLDWLRPDFVSEAREKCSTECIFTGDQSRVSAADGVVFHAKTHRPNDFPTTRQNQEYMIVSLEQEKYAPMLKKPNYMAKFDATMTFDLDSTLPMITVHPHWTAAHYFEAKILPFDQKIDAASAFVSNCRNAGASDRLAFLGRLMNSYTTHSYGRCLHNKDEPPLQKGHDRGEAKRNVIARHKFYLAFENDIQSKDYVSEKIYDAFLAGTLPVYRGTRTVDKLVPSPRSLVHAADFEDNPEQLGRHLAYLARNRTAYEAYFDWRKPPFDTPATRAQFQKILDMTAYKYTALCRICAHLAERSP